MNPSFLVLFPMKCTRKKEYGIQLSVVVILFIFFSNSVIDSYVAAFDTNRHSYTKRNINHIKHNNWYDHTIPRTHRCCYDNIIIIHSNNHDYQPDTSPTIQRFRQWLVEEQECEGIDATEIGYNCIRFNNNNNKKQDTDDSNTTTNSDNDNADIQQSSLRGLYAKESFEAGEYILAIPWTACLVVHEDIYDMDSDDKDDKNNGNKDGVWDDIMKAQCLLKLQKENQNNLFQPYLDCLPTYTTNFDPTPDFWDYQTISLLEVPNLIHNIMTIKNATIQAAAAAKADDACKDWHALQFATWLLRSRGFSTFKLLPNLKEQRIRTCTMLIPYLDFLNHSFHPNAKICKIESKHESESYFALIATNRIESGQALTITYGTGYETTLDMWTKYGFWLSQNPNDIRLDLDSMIHWSTSLEEDEQTIQLLHQFQETSYTLQALEIRAHLKRIQQPQQLQL